MNRYKHPVRKIWLWNSFKDNGKVKGFGANYDKNGDPNNPRLKWYIFENAQAYLDGKLDVFLGKCW